MTKESYKPSQNQTGQRKTKNIKFITKKETSIEVPKWAPLAILVLTALLYSKALQNGFSGGDDDLYIVNNSLIRHFNLNSIRTIFSAYDSALYQPFVLLTYIVEYKLFGLNPFYYHLSNVLLHLLNTWLVFKLSEQLSEKKITAVVVSLLFAVHPMHVESVAWITERKDVLYTFFYLSSLLVYLQYCKSGFQLKYYVWVLLLFIASLFSKSVAVTLPLLLIAIDIYKGRKINLKSLLEKVPFFILSFFFGILAIVSQKEYGAVYDTLIYSFIERIFLLTYAISFYIVEFIVPFHLSAMHYYPEASGGALTWVYYASLPFLLLLVLLLFRNTSLRKEVLFGIFFFLITISVMLQILPVGRAITAERYSYVSYIGLFYIVGQFISTITKKKVQNIVIGLFSLSIIVFSVQTWNRIGVWKNGETLFTDILEKYPDNSDGYYLRAVHRCSLKIQTKNLNGALKDMNKAITLFPHGDYYAYRGIIKVMQNNNKEAIDDFNSSLQLTPGVAKVYYNRGVARLALKDTIGTFKDWETAKELGHEKAAIQLMKFGN